MVERVLIELDGNTPRFRVSRPGKSVFSSNPGDFLIREDIPVYRAAVHGQRSFAGTGNIDVPISGIAGPCFVVARSSDLTPPGFQPPVSGPADPGFWYTCLISNTLLTIRNFNTERTIYFSVFGNPILGE